MAAPGDRPFKLGRAVTAMRGALGIPSGGRALRLKARWRSARRLRPTGSSRAGWLIARAAAREESRRQRQTGNRDRRPRTSPASQVRWDALRAPEKPTGRAGLATARCAPG